MIQRGRPSKTAAKAKAAGIVVVEPEFGTRPEPPEDLQPDEAVIWRAVVSSEDPTWFATAATQGMLSDMCRHRAAADKITRVINLFQDEWLRSSDGAKRFTLLLQARDKESRAAADKATKLRLTNQARYTTQLAGRMGRDAAKGHMPWDDLV